jgi:hypothetical protein
MLHTLVYTNKILTMNKCTPSSLHSFICIKYVFWQNLVFSTLTKFKDNIAVAISLWQINYFTEMPIFPNISHEWRVYLHTNANIPSLQYQNVRYLPYHGRRHLLEPLLGPCTQLYHRTSMLDAPWHENKITTCLKHWNQLLLCTN